MADGSIPSNLRPALDELAGRGTHLLRAARVRAFVREGLPFALFCTVLPPLVVLVVQGVQRLGEAVPWQPGTGAIVAAMAGVFVVVLVALGAWAGRRPIDRHAALALFDRAVDADERLITADALLAAGTARGFAAAALEDARWFLRPALAARPAAPSETPTSSLGRGVLYALAGLVLAWSFGGLGAGGVGDAGLQVPGGSGTDVAAAPQRGRETPMPEGRPRKADVEEEEPGPDALLEVEERATTAAVRPGELPEESRRKEGKGGAGRSSEAQPSRGESEARGSPTNQGPDSKKPTVKKPLKPEAKKKKKARAKRDEAKEEPKKSAGEESGSTAGRGSSKGSNKNPVTSDWTSKDQVTTEDDEEIEDDEEVEDDTEDSEARGGMQPSLRDRKPPVSRDLTIGFGNQPNPNAAGRGGPSQPKKSRGTASLVLGVPIPDRVKGQPNPGKTKITQERVEPRREQAPPGEAEARTPRRGPTGPLAAPRFAPWLRDLLRRHFLEPERQPR